MLSFIDDMYEKARTYTLVSIIFLACLVGLNAVALYAGSQDLNDRESSKSVKAAAVTASTLNVILFSLLAFFLFVAIRTSGKLIRRYA